MPTRKSTPRKSRGPYIESITPVHGARQGKPVTRIVAGTVLRIEGGGFGKSAGKVRVRFDEIDVEPFAFPFAADSLVVTAPLPVRATCSLAVRVDRRLSPAVELRVTRPSRPRGAPGETTTALFESVDRFATLVAASARAIAPSTEFSVPLRHAADQIDGLRSVNQRNLETLLQWRDIQELARQDGFPYEALQTIRRMDEQIHLGKLVRQSDRLSANTFGPRSAFARAVGPKRDAAAMLMSGRSIFEDAADALGSGVSTLAGTLGFFLHEATKIIESFEDIGLMESTSASVDGGGSAGAELTGGVDVSFSPAYGLSAVAKVIDTIAQLLMKVGAAGDSVALNAKLDGLASDIGKLETKADAQGNALAVMEGKSDQQGETLGRIETGVQQQETKLDGLTVAADRHSEKLDQLEVKSDGQDRKLDVLEAKGDRQGEKLDQIETKADRHEEKLDKLEAKADRQEEKLDVLEIKADRQEQKLDALEGKADRQEQKLDGLEGKADRQEGKLDTLDAKVDRQEGKLDRLEDKADRHEGKLDRLEDKADRQETKLDRIEEKLDREEEKLDRLSLPAPLEGSVASHLGNGSAVTAAVAATGATDNEVYLRALVDRNADELDRETSWSDWVTFGRPANAGGLLEVSIDLHYTEDSATDLNGLLSARDRFGNVHHRSFESGDHNDLLDPDRWSDWQSFLAQPV